jgi:hypothetical protein
VEALPFVLTSGNAPADADFSDDYDAGLDLRMGLGRSSTLAATFNPDFGQVEADPAVLNLGVFETFFPEKRPFFLSDGNIFVPSYGLFQLFHSRRIGARPGYLRPFQQGDVVLDRPEQTTILGATKVTGKSSGFTYGALTALTAEEHALVQAGGADGLGTARLDRTIEPMTSYSAACWAARSSAVSSRAYPPAPVASIVDLSFTNCAPRLSACSRVSGRTS